jgi:hypothetical protein
MENGIVSGKEHCYGSTSPIPMRISFPYSGLLRPNLALFAMVLCCFACYGHAATSPTNATVSIPRNIRVLQTNGVITYVPLETYVGRVLNQEWFQTWGDYPGGSNSLKAGAVVVRSYAINRLQTVGLNSTYDICASTACQVYRANSSFNTTNATAQTAGYVVTSSAFLIQGTEYSAENNSLGSGCGDGNTAPTGGCISDPVCLGETRNGHGRGMCQWGSAKWATGLKMQGNGSNYPGNANTGATNGFPKQTWDWIVNHYYPNSILLQATPLVDGDDISSTTTIRVYSAATTNSTLITTKAFGSKGVILTNAANGIQVTNDGSGFTWYEIKWSDGVVGWSPENWLQRVVPAPSAPFNLAITAVSSSQIKLSWSDTNVTELGFEIQRSPQTNGNWSTLNSVGPNLTNYSDTSVLAATTYYYRIRAYHAGGNSIFSNITNATTTAVAPILSAISNRVITEQSILTVTNSATAPDFEQTLNDFEPYPSGAGVMFRSPGFSGSTTNFLDSTATNLAETTTTFPTGTNHNLQVLKVLWTFTNTASPWLRLTTGGTTNMPNPVIDFTRKLKLDIYSDKTLKVALGCRETTNVAGTPAGSNGGSLGTIEFVGATGKTGTSPIPTRTVTASNWQTLIFDIPNEPKTNFTGDGVLSTASGLGVLEHLAFVPNGATGAYNVYLDNFIVATPKTLTYSLEPGAPAGATVNPTNGVLTWAPTEGQGPGSYSISVRVTDNSVPAQSDTKTFSVTVSETNTAPVLATITNHTIHAGSTLAFATVASDSDVPTNAMSFTLTNSPAGSKINVTNGFFSWTPLDSQADTTNYMTVVVTDNGTPPLSDSKNFSVIVRPRPTLQSTEVGDGEFTFNWNAIAGRRYRVQFKNDLSDPAWTDATEVLASGSFATFSEVPAAQRFYRIIDLP